LINGKKVGSGRVDRTQATVFSAEVAADVGVDEGTNVSVAYKERDNRFTGTLEKVVIEVGSSTRALRRRHSH
jgi:arylsulfatase